ncbi:reticulon-4a isoform X1 [Denticeps clupeoides]|nr:reticulon-3-like isoform X1 [Denticeps clupeoides]
MEDRTGVSSTTPSVDELLDSEFGSPAEPQNPQLFDDVAKYLLENREAEAQDAPQDDDDILDLAGGARDAIERHRSTLRRPDAPGVDSGSEASSNPPPAAVKPGHGESTAATSSGVLADLLYWRDIQRTGVVFGASLFLLLSLSVCSIISVCSYVALALLSVTISFRIYKGILQAVQKSEDGHPFKMYLDRDVAIPAELVHKYGDGALVRLNAGLKELRRLFLVEDLVDSLKFAVLMWILTYIGALFNGLTLLILGLIGVFSWPVIYEKHQAQIDHYYGLVSKQVKDVLGKIVATIPGMKPKAE